MNNSPGKRGEVSIHAFIYTALVLIGVVVLLLLITRIDFDKNVDRETCQSSVQLKASSPNILEAKNIVPLKCQTEKICVTDNLFLKGNCETLGVESEPARLEGDERYHEIQIRRLIADEMVECWRVMGEGKTNVFARDFELFNQKTNACVICSRIAFEEDIQKRIPEIRGTSRYMIENKMPGSEKTYWEYLTGSPILGPNLLTSGVLFDDADNLRTDTEKSIVFKEVRRTTGLGTLLGSLGAGVGVGAGVSVGSAVGGAIGTVLLPAIGTGAGLVVGGLVGTISAAVFGYAGYTGGEAVSEMTTALNEDNFKGDYFSSIYVIDSEKVSELDCGDNIESMP